MILIFVVNIQQLRVSAAGDTGHGFLDGDLRRVPVLMLVGVETMVQAG